MRPHARRVGQREEDIVVDLRARASRVELRVNSRHRPKEEERLVDQVATEVEQEAAGVLGLAALAPAHRHGGSPALEARLEAKDVAQGALGHELAQGEQLAIPTTV